jgi:long-subunit acyl-CoA synthetase (AMP-forming)
MSLFDAIRNRGMHPLVHSGAGQYRADEFLRKVRYRNRLLRQCDVRCLALLADNDPEWLITDLAARLAGVTLIPLPAFFTPRQLQNALAVTAADALVTDSAPLPGFRPTVRLTETLSLSLRPATSVKMPAGVTKVTFTSGTTAEPKGICLRAAALDAVAASIAGATQAVSVQRHLCALPLAVLLENVAGVYGAFLRGAELVVPPLHELGWNGGSSFDVARLLECLDRYQPQSMILLPQMLKALVLELTRTGKRLRGLRFVAVGGARTPAALVEAARALGVPAYEGYGLSECGSVVSLNVPGNDCPGSVGVPLPGREVRISSSGHIEIQRPGYLGYLGSSSDAPEWLDTGDVGHFDAKGFLHISGRSKNLLITGFGRNISPEWVESEILCEPGVLQAMVLGDAWPALGALLVTAPGTDAEAAVRRCNARLPDYARIGAWRSIDYMNNDNGLATANGRIRREHAASFHRARIESMREQIEIRHSGSTPSVSLSNRKGQACHSIQS